MPASPHRTSLRAGTMLTLLGVLVLGSPPLQAQSGAPAAGARAAAITPAQFAQLRWLDGAWRGRLPDGGFFYERYTFVDDSTIQMASFDDSSFTRSREGDRIVLRNGTVRYENVVATRLDASGIEFAAPARPFGFTWTRDGADRWTATIRRGGSEGRTIVYPLEAHTPADPRLAQEREAVRRAVLDYVEGFYEGDSTRLLRSIWPEVRKYGYARGEGENASYRGMAMTFPEGFLRYAAAVREGRVRTPAGAPKEITLHDVQDQTASARLTAWWGTDYLLLAKENGRWMITHVLWQSPPR